MHTASIDRVDGILDSMRSGERTDQVSATVEQANVCIEIIGRIGDLDQFQALQSVSALPSGGVGVDASSAVDVPRGSRGRVCVDRGLLNGCRQCVLVYACGFAVERVVA